MRRLFLPVWILVACESPTAATFPAGTVAFTPASIYREWWALTESCSTAHGDFDAVSWYVVPDTGTFELGGRSLAGAWYSASNSIVLASEAVESGAVVRHEMLHALLGRARHGTHPRAQFVGRCGGVVACDDDCLADGGPPPRPAAGAVAVSPEALEVAVTVTPPAPGSASLDGYFMMIVTARNRTTSPLLVQLPPSGDAGAPVSFRYVIEGGGYRFSYDMRADVPEVAQFAAGEVKEFVFDFRNQPGNTPFGLAPGTYRFSGAYSEVWAPAPPTVTVSP